MQPLDLQERTVPHLKDLINICMENESQGHGMTFNMVYDQSTLISYHTEAFVKTEVACTVTSVFDLQLLTNHCVIF